MHKSSLVILVHKSLEISDSLVKRSPNKAAMSIQIGEITLVNTYLPSGLDHVRPRRAHLPGQVDDFPPSHQLRIADIVDETYAWIQSSLCTHSSSLWLVAGDFNETLTPLEECHWCPQQKLISSGW